MKSIILYLSISIALFSCTSNDEREVMFFNDISLGLNDGEEITPIDTEKKEEFQIYFANASIQVPLYRCIKGGNYSIYLGIPVSTTVNELADFRLNHIDHPSAFESDSATYFYINHQKEANYITEYSKAFDNNLIYILAISNSFELSDSLFNREALLKRFNH